MQIKGIACDTLDFILEASKSMAPEEFAGLLQEKDGIITEVLILPGTESSEQNAVIKLFMMPNIEAVGSIHSHPGPNRKPSQADLNLFSKTGNCHIIVGHPYNRQSWTCYDREGNVRELQVLDAKFEDFEGANLDGANFEGANLEGSDFKKANLEEADLEGTDLVGANLEGTDLVGAKLVGANLEEANLKRANLRSADLKEADLKEADFEGANLKGANELTIDQLSKVKTLYNAKLDNELLTQLKEKYPALFEKPEERE
jgi:proteasome lid subunit RPN8/RPN11